MYGIITYPGWFVQDSAEKFKLDKFYVKSSKEKKSRMLKIFIFIHYIVSKIVLKELVLIELCQVHHKLTQIASLITRLGSNYEVNW